MQAKNDSLKVTGGGGGTEALLGPLEVAVLEVIGRDSAAVKGLSVKESSVGALESTKSTSSSCATSIAGQFPGATERAPISALRRALCRLRDVPHSSSNSLRWTHRISMTSPKAASPLEFQLRNLPTKRKGPDYLGPWPAMQSQWKNSKSRSCNCKCSI